MDEDLAIINNNTRNQKIKNFFINNKKFLIILSVVLLLLLLIFYSFQIYKDKNRELISNEYNSAIIKHKNGDKIEIVTVLKKIIKEKNSTYSPLALYYLIDNSLVDDKFEINDLFNILIEKTPLEKEIKYLIIYKKALFNADNSNEKEMLDILNPLINSKSIWKSHGLYLMAEYFYSKNEKQKSKEFFNQIISLENVNQDLKIEAQKRLNRDLSE
tara:strand:- start:293 stop:937 length:645 start_codon:yes stop_codon:yes gene_type:complete